MAKKKPTFVSRIKSILANKERRERDLVYQAFDMIRKEIGVKIEGFILKIADHKRHVKDLNMTLGHNFYCPDKEIVSELQDLLKVYLEGEGFVNVNFLDYSALAMISGYSGIVEFTIPG